MYDPGFEVKLYYGIKCTNKLSKPGNLAVHTWAGDQLARDMEVQAGITRPDIGAVTVLDNKAGTGWVVIYDESIEIIQNDK